MPIYVFRCRYCNEAKEFVYRSVADRDAPEVCSNCAEPMERQITTPSGSNFTPYYHRALGVQFDSRSEERKYAKKNGLVDVSGDFHKYVEDGKPRWK